MLCVQGVGPSGHQNILTMAFIIIIIIMALTWVGGVYYAFTEGQKANGDGSGLM